MTIRETAFSPLCSCLVVVRRRGTARGERDRRL